MRGYSLGGSFSEDDDRVLADLACAIADGGEAIADLVDLASLDEVADLRSGGVEQLQQIGEPLVHGQHVRQPNLKVPRMVPWWPGNVHRYL